MWQMDKREQRGACSFVHPRSSVRCWRIRHVPLTLLLAYCCFASLAKESPFPFIYTEYGSSDGDIESIVPSCHALGFLSQELLPIARLKREMGEGAEIASHRLTQLTTTSFGPVYDLFLKLRSTRYGIYDKIKLIVVAFGDEYCPVYLHLFLKSAYPGPNDSFVVKMGELEIVASEMVESGTGVFVSAVYFLIEGAGIRKLHTKPGFKQAFSGLVPDGCGIWKGGGFDIRTLTYRKPVWCDGDANCCPSGGRVEIDFRIDDDQLVPIRNVYFPPGERPSD